MCQKFPRPRCSAHTLDKYEREQASYDALAKQIGRSKNRKMLDELHQQHQKVDEARRDYNASPEGLRSLQEKIADARARKARGDLDEYSWQYEIAIQDAIEHKLAGRIYDRAGEELEKPHNDTNLIEAYNKEREANAKLAAVLNNSKNPVSIASAKLAAKEAKQRRLAQENSFLLRASGVPEGQKSAVEASAAHSKIKSDTSQPASYFTYLPPSDFKKVGECFPLGAYAKIEDISKDQFGNYVLMLEGGKERILPSSKKILAVF